MPMSKYDPMFGGTGGAAKAHAAMVEEYGAKKGAEVFYATMNKRMKKQKHTMLQGASHAAAGGK